MSRDDQQHVDSGAQDDPGRFSGLFLPVISQSGLAPAALRRLNLSGLNSEQQREARSPVALNPS